MHQLLASLLSHLSANEDGCTLLIKGGDFLTGCEKGLRDMGLGGGGTAKARDVPRQAALLQVGARLPAHRPPPPPTHTLYHLT